MKFVGKKYRDEKEKQEILNSYDDFQREKLIFLNELYDNENTLFAMWRIYDRYIHSSEVYIKKDLKYFDTRQVKNILSCLFIYSDDTIRTVCTFMRIYFEYCVGKAEIFQNPTEIIDIDIYLERNRKSKENKIYSLDYVYNLVDDAKRYSSFSNVIPLLLIRYGVKGNKMSWLVNLKWSDIDFDNKQINIFDRNEGKLITNLPVDDRLLETLDQYRNYLADKNILNEYVSIPCIRFIEDNISAKTQKKFEIGYDYKSQRITIPWRSIDGNIIGISSRNNDDYSDAPKYLALKSFKKSNHLYGLFQNYNEIVSKRKIIIVESEKSVLQAYDMGIKNVVAVGCHSISENQIYLLKYNVDMVTIMFDKDVAEDEVKEQCKKIKDKLGIKVYYCIDSKDLLNEKESVTDRGINIFMELCKQIKEYKEVKKDE